MDTLNKLGIEKSPFYTNERKMFVMEDDLKVQEWLKHNKPTVKPNFGKHQVMADWVRSSGFSLYKNRFGMWVLNDRIIPQTSELYRRVNKLRVERCLDTFEIPSEE